MKLYKITQSAIPTPLKHALSQSGPISILGWHSDKSAIPPQSAIPYFNTIERLLILRPLDKIMWDTGHTKSGINPHFNWICVRAFILLNVQRPLYPTGGTVILWVAHTTHKNAAPAVGFVAIKINTAPARYDMGQSHHARVRA